MSAQTLSRAAAGRPEPGRSVQARSAPTRSGRGALRLVQAAPATAARAPFVAVVVALLAVGLLGLLLLNTALAQDAFRLHLLKAQGAALADQELDLQRQVEALRAPAALAARARALGLVQAGPPAYLRLADGAVLGVPTAAVSPAAPAQPTTVQPTTVQPTTVQPTAPASPAPPRRATSPAIGQKAPQSSTTWTAPRPSAPPSARAGSR